MAPAGRVRRECRRCRCPRKAAPPAADWRPDRPRRSRCVATRVWRLNARAQVRGSDVALALVDHLDVAAERNRRQRPLGAVGAEATRPDDAAESDRKTQHLDPDEPRHDVVAELVKDHEHAERHGEGEQFLQQSIMPGAPVRWSSSSNCRVSARAPRGRRRARRPASSAAVAASRDIVCFAYRRRCARSRSGARGTRRPRLHWPH